MLAAIIPVKTLAVAKGRLAGVLAAPERRALVLAMLGDVLATLVKTRGVDRIGVISADATVLARAAALGAEPLIDRAPDLNAALAQAAAHYAALGATATLVMPADVPLIAAEEIERMIALRVTRGIVIAPSRDGGTNALLTRPPLALPFLFGPQSRERHLQAAREYGVDARIFQSRGLGLDVDRPDDLLLLAELAGDTAAQQLARELMVCERVACV
ncbi:MAG: 2-phospho-L-lactate guanylyltransferase [Kouleothrix sp.]|nr:2-phospho-L-lactate guanylyltransferase [Kouleothrix sp.]